MLPSERIKILFEQSQMTYIEIEKKTGISKSALQRYASGITKKIPIDAVEKIAKLFGVTVAYIMGCDIEKPAIDKGNGLSQKRQRFYDKIMELDNRQFQIVNEIVDSVLRERDE